MKKNQATIDCPTFQRQEPLIKDISAKINRDREPQERTVHAEELQKEVDAFLSCPDYSDNSVDCKNCRLIANVRKKTAGLIIKAQKLA